MYDILLTQAKEKVKRVVSTPPPSPRGSLLLDIATSTSLSDKAIFEEL